MSGVRIWWKAERQLSASEAKNQPPESIASSRMFVLEQNDEQVS